MELYWIWISTIPGVGNVTIKKLIKKFKNPKAVFEASPSEIFEVEGITKNLKEKVINSKFLDSAEKVLAKCEDNEIKLINIDNINYPEEIRNLKKSPVLLYYKGKIVKNSIGVSIIGPKSCTEYGKRVTIEASEFLAKNNISIISGIERGVDQIAHSACINNKGYSIAFLPNGIDVYISRESEKLKSEIIENGAIVSQYPPGTYPRKYNYFDRNYLMAAWSYKLLIVEATIKELPITIINYAKELDKEILAVPNNIYVPESIGTNGLIADQAKLYYEPKQLLFSENLKKSKVESSYTHQSLQYKIIDIISKKACTLEEIVYLMDENKDNIIEVLSEMELKEEIKVGNGCRYSI